MNYILRWMLACWIQEKLTPEGVRLPAHRWQLGERAFHLLARAQVRAGDDAGLGGDVGAAAAACLDDVLGGQRLVGVVDGLDADAQAARQLAHAGDLLPSLEQAV